jgi:hypothetical protein
MRSSSLVSSLYFPGPLEIRPNDAHKQVALLSQATGGIPDLEGYTQ